MDARSRAAGSQDTARRRSGLEILRDNGLLPYIELRLVRSRLAALVLSTQLGCALAESTAPSATGDVLDWQGSRLSLGAATCSEVNFVTPPRFGFVFRAYQQGSTERSVRVILISDTPFPSGFPPLGDYTVPPYSTDPTARGNQITLAEPFGSSIIMHYVVSGAVSVSLSGERLRIVFANLPMFNVITNAASPASGQLTCE